MGLRVETVFVVFMWVLFLSLLLIRDLCSTRKNDLGTWSSSVEKLIVSFVIIDHRHYCFPKSYVKPRCRPTPVPPAQILRWLRQCSSFVGEISIPRSLKCCVKHGWNLECFHKRMRRAPPSIESWTTSFSAPLFLFSIATFRLDSQTCHLAS